MAVLAFLIRLLDDTEPLSELFALLDLEEAGIRLFTARLLRRRAVVTRLLEHPAYFDRLGLFDSGATDWEQEMRLIAVPCFD